MTSEALAKDLAVLKKDLKKVSDEIAAGHAELADLDRKRELARADLKNIQTLKDPLVANYDLRLEQKKKQLILLEADIAAAHEVKDGIDAAAAERLMTGQQAIDNAQRVERSIQDAIRSLRHREEALLQDIANNKAESESTSLVLTDLKAQVLSLEQQKTALEGWLKSKEEVAALQEKLERDAEDLNEGRDRLTERQEELEEYEQSLHVMASRLNPEYIEAFRLVNPHPDEHRRKTQ